MSVLESLSLLVIVLRCTEKGIKEKLDDKLFMYREKGAFYTCNMM